MKNLQNRFELPDDRDLLLQLQVTWYPRPIGVGNVFQIRWYALELKATSGRQKLTLPDWPQLTDPYQDFGTMHFRTEPRVQSGVSRCARRLA